MADIDLDQLETELKSNIEGANDLAALDAVRVAALGKKGSISDLLKTLGAMDADTRKIQGPLINTGSGIALPNIFKKRVFS